MSLVCVASAHGAPGVTTAVLALAGVWPTDRIRLVVEADPFGGVLATRFGLSDSPGLVSLGAAARHGLDAESVWEHAQTLPGGVPVLVGPPSADQASAVLPGMSARLAEWSRDGIADVIADCGRVMPGSPNGSLLTGADVVLVLARPTADQLRPATHRARALVEAGVRAEVVLVGDRPYGPSEVQSVLGVSVAGVVAWDKRAALALSGNGGGAVRRSALVRSVAALAESVDVSAGAGESSEVRS